MQRDSDDESERDYNHSRSYGHVENISNSEDRHQAPSHMEPSSMAQHYRVRQNQSYEQEFINPDLQPPSERLRTPMKEENHPDNSTIMNAFPQEENVALTSYGLEVHRTGPDEKSGGYSTPLKPKNKLKSDPTIDHDPSNPFTLDPKTLSEVVEKIRPRKTPSEEIDALEQEGETGTEWILKELRVDPRNGISSSEIEIRRKYFGTNIKEEVKPSGSPNLPKN